MKLILECLLAALLGLIGALYFMYWAIDEKGVADLNEAAAAVRNGAEFPR
jgi:hypothetical protein